jgi:putative tricarboxylic transport membrane protein
MSAPARFAVSPRRGEVVVAAILLLLSIAILAVAVRMPAGTLGAPGPGFFPGILSALLAVTSVGLLLRAWRSKAVGGAPIVLGHRDIAITLLALVVVGIVFESAGYVLCATGFMLVMLRALSSLGWIRSLLAAIACAVASYFFFVSLLGVALPAGVLPLA